MNTKALLEEASLERPGVGMTQNVYEMAYLGWAPHDESLDEQDDTAWSLYFLLLARFLEVGDHRAIGRVLFLDFDGVTHPVNARDKFGWLPHLEALLRQWPDVRVVIASSWRRHRTIEQLREPFAADLRLRVVGVAPLLRYRAGAGQGHRQAECHAWLRQHAPGADWLAIDDEGDLWSDRERVVLCDPRYGLSCPAAIESIARWLQEVHR